MAFIKQISKKWILWVFLILDAIGAILHIFLPGFEVPNALYVLVPMFGLFIASFETYRELLSQIPHGSIPIEPKVSISLLEGNEYYFRLQKISNISEIIQSNIEFRGRESSLPNSEIIIHVRAENIGLLPTVILTITGKIEMYTPFHFKIPICYADTEESFSFPSPLDPKETLSLLLIGGIEPFALLTDAQFSSRVRRMALERKLQ